MYNDVTAVRNTVLFGCLTYGKAENPKFEESNHYLGVYGAGCLFHMLASLAAMVDSPIRFSGDRLLACRCYACRVGILHFLALIR